MRNSSKSASVVLISVLGSLIFLNLISVGTFTRVDLTENQIFTLSEASQETAEALEDQVTISAYFTSDLPPPYSSYSRYVRDLLQEYRAASKGKVAFEFVDPTSQETAEDKEKKKEMKRDIFGRPVREATSVEQELATLGVQPVEIRVLEDDQQQTKRAYMGIAIRYQESSEVIPVVQNIATLEYDITTLIRKMTRSKTPVLGVIHDHEESKIQQLQTVLSQIYDVRSVELTAENPVIDDDVDALLVVGPKEGIVPGGQAAIDQFIMNGGSVAFFLDRLHVDMRTFEITDAVHGLAPMLKTYGVELKDELVADVESAQLSVAQRRGFMVVNIPVQYPFMPRVAQLEGNSAITHGLGNLVFPYAAPLSYESNDQVEFTTLAKSSAKSWTETYPTDLMPTRDWNQEQVSFTGPYDLAVVAKGKFKSHFANAVGGAEGALAESKEDGRIVVVGTSSFMWDQVGGRLGQAFVLNLIDWLMLDEALLSMRTRGMTAAPLEKDLSDATRNGVKYGNMLGVPFLFCLYGVIRWRTRERRRHTIQV
ncbi:MAG: ABC transporter permease [Myxococcales bacterium]|nr:ABC transporter permease [Myxococcales bacterium]